MPKLTKEMQRKIKKALAELLIDDPGEIQEIIVESLEDTEVVSLDDDDMREKISAYVEKTCAELGEFLKKQK